MTKFKRGDKIKRIRGIGFSKGELFHKEGDIVEFSHYDYGGDEIIVDVNGLSGFSDNYKLVTPATPTRFEVGKKYRRINGVTIYEIIHLGETRVFYHTDHNQEGCIGKSLFHKFVEYIPPPPEEWRIVYKDKFGNVTVGKTPFKSESEAKASPFWTDHSDQDAFKTIRVDA